MAIWVGKQKMSCRSCIKGHRSSTCNHIGGPLWAVRPAGRPNKACIHGPGDLCLCAHYFPLTWLKAAVPRNKKCSCQGPGSGSKKCSCGGGAGAGGAGHGNGNGHGMAAAAGGPATPEDETQPIFYQDLVARGLQVTTEPVDLDVPAPVSAPGGCCSVPAAASCCSQPVNSASMMPVPVPAPAPAIPASSCCGGGGGGGGGGPAVKSGSVTPTHPPMTNGHIKTESMSSAPFTPIQQFQPPPDFPVMKFSPVSNGGTPADHVCECGPTCNCVLCIDHPYNNATMNHIATEFGQMMSSSNGNGPQFSPTQSIINGHRGTTNEYFPRGWQPNGMFPPGFNDQPSLMSTNQPQQTHSPPQQATDMDIILNPADFQMFNFAFPPMEEGDQGASQFGGGCCGGANDLGGMEPMSDMTDMMDLNGFCGGAPEGCPCGDDCACIGCQIHKPTNGFANGAGNAVGPPSWG